MQTPTYTFLSISTPKPGKLDELVRVASRPSELMDAAVDGVIARQVSVDRERQTVVVWTTPDRRETMMDYLASPAGQAAHTGGEDLDAIIETFEMYDLTPVSGRIG